MSEQQQTSTFAYEARSQTGGQFTGTIEAPDLDSARGRLAELGLQLVHIEQVKDAPVRGRKLTGDDFAIFNQQLAYMTQAGLPLERSLRLIGRDIGSGRLADTLNALAEDLEKGETLGDAFRKYRKRFPPLYGDLVEVGVESGQLPLLLFNLSRHLQTMRRLRQVLWEALTYPFVLVIALMAVTLFVSVMVIPEFADIYTDFDTQLPLVTRSIVNTNNWLLGVDAGQALPGTVYLLLGLALLISVFVVTVYVLGRRPLSKGVIISTPLVGPVVRFSLVSQWCDVVRICIEAGVDLTRAMNIAGKASGYEPIGQESTLMIEAVGQNTLESYEGKRGTVPATVPVSIAIAQESGNLAQMLDSLRNLYQRRSELRISAISTLLLPIVVILAGLAVATLVFALFLPLVRVTTSLM